MVGYGLAMMKCLAVSLFVAAVLGGATATATSAVGGAVEAARKVVHQQVPAMYVFGDSTLDVGNNNFLPGANVPRANRPLYGVDFPGSTPTGRFSNGYNVADFIAKKLGLRESPPAYLWLAAGTGLVRSAVTRGVSYASAGAGILDSTNAGNAIPLSKQVRWFEATRTEVRAKVGARAASSLFSRSFFLVGVGSNDLFVFAASGGGGQSTAGGDDAVAALYSSLISTYSAAITDLYGMGARKFGVINVGLLGCVPAVRVLNATGACGDGLNQLAAGFDGELKSLLASLVARLPGLAYSLADSYSLTQATFADPQASGYVKVDTACCGGGRLGAESDCLPNSTLCADRDQFVFWDKVHPSQRAGELSAAAFYDDGAATFTAPISFKQLAQKTV